ncbi:putative hemolysin [Shewanella sp. GXUN23E]|uniref:putative hemolysin n=1 Tax=Shewanella sp. GXUN23E TaxID=3422498 RepID=UPI003D7C9C68
MKLSLAVVIASTTLVLSACQPTPAEQQAEVLNLANPAAKHCIALGGQYQIKDTPDGLSGRCLYQGQDWDAWELFRRDSQ